MISSLSSGVVDIFGIFFQAACFAILIFASCILVLALIFEAAYTIGSFAFDGTAYLLDACFDAAAMLKKLHYEISWWFQHHLSLYSIAEVLQSKTYSWFHNTTEYKYELYNRLNQSTLKNNSIGFNLCHILLCENCCFHTNTHTHWSCHYNIPNE